MNIKIKKLPDDLNIDNRIDFKMIETYSGCPYCGTVPYEILDDGSMRYHAGTISRTRKFEENNEYDEPRKISGTGLFAKKYHWRRYLFCCNNCGMEWYSPSFPVGLAEDEKANEMIFKAWLNGKDLEVNTLLLECSGMKGAAKWK